MSMSVLKNVPASFLTMFLLCMVLFTPVSFAAQLPENLQWETNDKDPVYAAAEVEKGGTLRSSLLSFPLTLRYVGPDSNGAFRSAILGNKMGLVMVHPNTGNLLPSLATHWAYSDDNTTMYFKLNPDARWSDGKPVTPDDFVFTLEFMRSKEIVAPWYNTYYSEEIGEVVVYDEHTISVSSAKPRPRDELPSHVAISPTPRHFYKDMSNFVQRYNWAIAPNTGPYQISKIKKGKSITFARNKSWWAKDLKYYRNRFNIDKIRFTIIRDINVAWEHFKKGKLDIFGITLPDYWHDKAKGEIFDKGYVHKQWFYSETPQGSSGLWLNQDDPILKDRNLRLGLAHSLNIEKVNKQVLRGDYQRKQVIHSGFGKFTNKNIRAREYSLDKANEYFDKAGWNKRGRDGIREKDGKRLSLTITYGTEFHTPRLVVLKEEYKRAGVELVLRKLDPAASFKSVLEKKHQIWWGGLGGGRFPQYWGQFHSVNAHKPQTNNLTNTDDAQMDDLIEAFRSAMQTEERIRLAHELQALIHEQGAYIPTLDVPYDRIAFWRWIGMPEIPGTRIGGSAVSAFDFNSAFDVSDGGLLWIDTKVKKQTRDAMDDGKAFPAVTRINEIYRETIE
jgi:microcin C transport system substrate-binding protein